MRITTSCVARGLGKYGPRWLAEIRTAAGRVVQSAGGDTKEAALAALDADGAWLEQQGTDARVFWSPSRRSVFVVQPLLSAGGWCYQIFRAGSTKSRGMTLFSAATREEAHAAVRAHADAYTGDEDA